MHTCSYEYIHRYVFTPIHVYTHPPHTPTHEMYKIIVAKSSQKLICGKWLTAFV